MKFKLILCGVLLIVGCTSKKYVGPLKAIAYVDNAQTTYADGFTEDDIGSFKIIYSPKATLYEVWHINYEVVKSTVVNKVIENEIAPTTDTVFRYFLVKKKDSIGLAYDGLDDVTKGTKFPLDSLLEQLTINEKNMEVFALALGNPIHIEKEGEHVKIEKYYTKSEPRDADSIYRYYDSRLKNIPFSFAPALDKENNSKLYKTRLIYLPKTKDKPREELITEIRLAKINHLGKIAALLKRFESDVQKIKQP